MAPVERRLVRPFVGDGHGSLRRVHPTVVAITGSYGKTSTKSHIAYLVAGTRTVVATPASFNNRAGLARAINEHLAEGTEVFVAEMGTYGPGEIAELCCVVPARHRRDHGHRARAPRAVRVREDADRGGQGRDHRAAARSWCSTSTTSGWPAWPTGWPRAGRKVVRRCSAVDPQANVCVVRHEGTLHRVRRRRGAGVGRSRHRSGSRPTNVACAVAVALQLGVPATSWLERLAASCRRAQPVDPGRRGVGRLGHRRHLQRQSGRGPGGPGLLAAIGARRRRVVVTPGMVELGPRQAEENQAFAEAAAQVATDLVVVGRTNRRALSPGPPRLVPVVVAHPGGGGGLGPYPSRARTTPCSTRTTCRTTTLSRSEPARRRGGPPHPLRELDRWSTSPSSSEGPRPSTT